ncbi:hypothetical protein [Kitasatospora sp. NPDC005856]
MTARRYTAPPQSAETLAAARRYCEAMARDEADLALLLAALGLDQPTA